MTIEEIIASRGISDILHFTTNHGLAGILATGAVKSRARLSRDKYLEHILKLNCPDRSRDAAWHNYVNLSISRINSHLFRISEGNWHRALDGWWCVLSFDPRILAHDGVVFATTNNMYTGVIRRSGPQGLEALFSPRITRWCGCTVKRQAETASFQPTCFQAEVLYPGELPLEDCQGIFVRDDEHLDEVHAMFAALSVSTISCETDAGRFA